MTELAVMGGTCLVIGVLLNLRRYPSPSDLSDSAFLVFIGALLLVTCGAVEVIR